jgi:hypothetical protein
VCPVQAAVGDSSEHERAGFFARRVDGGLNAGRPGTENDDIVWSGILHDVILLVVGLCADNG